MSRVLYILACAAPPARDVGVLAGLALDRGWDVCVITSAHGRAFVGLMTRPSRGIVVDRTVTLFRLK